MPSFTGSGNCGAEKRMMIKVELFSHVHEQFQSFTSKGVEQSGTFTAKERGGTNCLLFLLTQTRQTNYLG